MKSFEQKCVELVEWMHGTAVDGSIPDPYDIQDKMLDLEILEQRPANPDENEWGADTLLHLKRVEFSDQSTPDDKANDAKDLAQAGSESRSGCCSDSRHQTDGTENPNNVRYALGPNDPDKPIVDEIAEWINQHFSNAYWEYWTEPQCEYPHAKCGIGMYDKTREGRVGLGNDLRQAFEDLKALKPGHPNPHITTN